MVANCELKTYWASGMVWFDWSVRMINGRRKSFQAHSAVRMAMVALIGLISGKMMVQKMRHVDAPSIRAASSSETGMVLTYPSTRKIPIGSPKDT